MLMDRVRDSVAGGAHVGEEPSWREIDLALRRIAKQRAALDAEEAIWLVAAQRARVHRQLGMGSFREYLERVLGYGPRTAQDRIRVAVALAELPEMAAALARGDISFSTVREVSRVAKANTERVWLGAVAGKTVREVEQAVAGRRPGDLPETPPDPELLRSTLRLDVKTSTLALFREARQQLERETGERLSDDAFVAMLCRGALAGGSAAERPPHQIAITTCGDCKRGWQEAGGLTVEVPEAKIERARCDATEIGRIDGPTARRASQTVPPAIRRAVIQRDHERCRVPGCRAATYVDIHHIVPRAQSGTHDPWNLLLLCDAHHDAVHEGRLVVGGRAPDALVFQHADGKSYGTEPTNVELAEKALKQSGFSAAEANAAVEEACAHVGADVPLERLIFEAFRAGDVGKASRDAESGAVVSAGAGRRRTRASRSPARGTRRRARRGAAGCRRPCGSPAPRPP